MGVLDQRGNLQGKRAFVIGGAAGIGKAVTIALAEAGVDIAFCDKNEGELKQTRAEVEAMGRKVVAQVANAYDPPQLKRFYETAAQTFDAVDIVVNVVGGVLMQPFMEKSPESCAEDIQRNFGYVIESTRMAVPLMRRTGRGGSIINFTTIESIRGAGGFAVYAGAKAAVANFSRAMACELGPEKIRMNVIAPDTTNSEGNTVAMPPALHAINADVTPEQWAGAMKMYIPLGEQPLAEDLANTVLFLASDLARMVNGQTIHVDGGTSATLGFIRWPTDNVTLPVAMGGDIKKMFPRT